MFVTNPTWLEEAYQQPINSTDVGYVTRNLFLSRKTLILFVLLYGTKGTFLDYAAGYGMLVRLMRDYGMNFLWDDRYTENLFAKGFEYTDTNTTRLNALTCFECFEHFPNPIIEIEHILTMTDTLLFSTLLKPNNTRPSKDWTYYGFEHGQHVSFYSHKTLVYIANRFDMKVYTNNHNLHLLTKKKLPNRIITVIDLLTKLQCDVLVRKFLRSKIAEDQQTLISQASTL